MFNEHTKYWGVVSVVTLFNEHTLHEGALCAPGGVQPVLLSVALMRTLSWNNRLKNAHKTPRNGLRWYCRAAPAGCCTGNHKQRDHKDTTHLHNNDDSEPRGVQRDVIFTVGM